MEHSRIRRNPSREVCENTIKRILMTEVLEHGSNRHFKTAADFLPYFESLYPASDALTKQVQRAVKALDMPKDAQGFFIVNKTAHQFGQEKEITQLFSQAHVKVHSMEQTQTVFLEADPHMREYLLHMLQTSVTFQGKFLTLVATENGILIYTENRSQLLVLLNSLTI
ncbi:MAG: hypothetical protein NC180_10980 [Muribaculaceae bacterium]|nr:hypothetical protein [Roseburia sp.]MCM1432010.1 hypothetical protein [Muribaculaceae bacterium]MCM1493736.1 hypothetical protein [Muribaculaceae bacterium]